jgi:hypothetical protein
MPFLLMVRMAEVDTFNSTQRFSSGMKKRFFCRLGLKFTVGLDVRVGHGVAAHKLLAGNVTNS